MTYDEFGTKLRLIKSEFERANGKPLRTLEELELFLARRLVRPKKKGLRSLKGVGL